jgi:hypothetical protein
MASEDRPLKVQKLDEGSSVSPSDGSDEEDSSPRRKEYMDIDSVEALKQHLYVSTDESIEEGCLKLHMIELGLHAWYLEPTKFMKALVSIFLV